MVIGTGEPPPDSAPGRRPGPARSEQFEHLTLDSLRAYRHALGQEEGRVSYWRRIIQARLDVVRLADDNAGSTGSTGSADDVRRLRTVLAESRIPTNRGALLDVVPMDGAPPLPDLASLWTREPSPDRQANARLTRELSFAEVQLSAYRGALHRRLSGATAELIARYHEDPLLCLSALPLENRARAAG